MSSPNQSRSGGARVRVPPPFIFLSGILLGALIDSQLHRWPLPLSGVGPAFAAALATAGLGLIGWALVHFRRTGQDPEPWKPSPEIIPDGPYRFTRNPMYIGMLLIQCAAGFFLDSAWILLLAPASLLAVHHTAVLPEERYLAERFGEPYLAFLRTVPRYLGRGSMPRGVR